ncbi:uncharacterized protein LOC105207840 [Solenopsis invicta]|uniref:uncharacterized protein LOC105207840 n=1 Tax=Solenopsis invicta TaxID=13686 RepID=UPI000595AEBA|nr:uncharacterized protein LOC105207840 [Solenopsis invicta]
MVDFRTEVKYLGVILDQKLTWNSHLKKVQSKAALALHTCRRLLVRNWGLRPKMILWSYMAIVRPMVTYAAAVWWPKTEQRAAQLQLQKIQRLAYLSVTEAMRTCPTAALEAILDLLPLHLQVRKVAASSAICLSHVTPMPTSRTGHMRILITDGLCDIAQLPMDAMKTKFNFVRNYKTVYTDRETWAMRGPLFKRGALQWYTDGSKTAKSGTGAGISGPNYRASIFNALHLPGRNIGHQLLRQDQPKQRYERRNNRHTNRQPSCGQGSHSLLCDSTLVCECITKLKLLAEDNHVTLWWISGHKGIKGNEEADELAKKGARSLLIEPEPWCGVNASYIKKHLTIWEDELKFSYWSDTRGLAQAKKFITYSPQRTRDLLSLDKRDLTTLVGLLSGHCQLKYYLNTIGKIEDDDCRFCMETTETAEHIMCNCLAVGHLRQEFMGGILITPDQIRKLDPRRVVRFFKSLDLAQF